MGNCCGNEEEQKPLLNSGNVGVRSGTLSHTVPVVTESPQSARQHNPVAQRDFETSIEMISTVQLQTIPIATIDKTFKDLGKLYNEVIDNFRSLETETHNFKEYFVADTAGIPVLATCVTILRKRAGDAVIKLERKSMNFIELTYDTKEITNTCAGDPETVIKPLEHFSNACRHIRNVLAHAPQVEHNVKIILQDEDTLKKEIMKADLSTTEIQQGIKTFCDNVSKLRTVAAGTDTIKRDVEKKFKEFSKASEGFFIENES
ncbi:uncharacterized protein LOC123534641 [Mercenaria mercenaria]|uniref:uncharacterized protein LOC123534641 n=1 Tax=Mercenaria mercenaria TaxID=6596 RepID=UPI00234EB40F|nr:uncharacterized protein LOC123534641 [Mercenaria mercenaria]